MTNNETPKWYIATTIIGNEEVVYKNIEDKIRAYGLNDLVKEIKLLKSREITIEIFDNKTNPPPKLMRNTKSIIWETLPGNRYKKTRIREINRFPGYIYVQMIMTPEAWYAIRNTYGITGFVGSSGKGAQPIPMSDADVERLFDPSLNEDIIINKSDDYDLGYVENTVEPVIENKPEENTKEIEFLTTVPEIISVNNKPFVTENDKLDNDGFFNSQIDTEKPSEEKINTDNSDDIMNEMINEDINQTENLKETYLTEELQPNTIEEENKENITTDYSIRVGTFVKIIDGSMKDSVGYITSIDNENKQFEVEIELLGRKSKVVVGFNEVTTEDVNE